MSPPLSGHTTMCRIDAIGGCGLHVTSVCQTSARRALVAVEHDDLGVLVVELGDERVDLDLTEAAGQRDVPVRGELLRGHEHDVVPEQRVVECFELRVGDVLDVEAADLRAERAGHRANVEIEGRAHAGPPVRAPVTASTSTSTSTS